VFRIGQDVGVSDTTELLDTPFAFATRWLKTPREFVSYADSLGLHVNERTLERLHTGGLLQPIFGVRRDVEAINQAILDKHPGAHAFGHQTTSWPDQLRELHRSGRLYDPATLPEAQPRWVDHETEGIKFRSDWFLYSAFQIIGLKQALRSRDLPEGSAYRETALQETAAIRRTVRLLLALEPRFHSELIGLLPEMSDESIWDFYEWIDDRTVSSKILSSMGWTADEAETTGRDLVRDADSIDPLRDWLDLVSQVGPNRRKDLKGAALFALELRYAAEALFRAAAEANAETTEEQTARLHQDRRGRPRRLIELGDLDGTLTRYGISPHPSLLLVVEGATEKYVIPAVMQALGFTVAPNFIRVVDRHGVGQSLTPLLDHALVPYTGTPEPDGRIPLHRPVTRLLVVTDPEGKLTTDEQRTKAVNGWKAQIEQSLPKGPVRSSVATHILDDLVHLETWNDQGASFEFAHFSDHEIASAIAAQDKRDRAQSVAGLEAVVAKRRVEIKGITDLVDNVQGSKTELAKALTPLVLKKIEGLNQSEAEATGIPVVRIVLKAVQLAGGFSREGVGLAPPPSDESA
jgi:hypothetical protein